MTQRDTAAAGDRPAFERGDETYTARYDWDDADTPSSAIVRAVAAVRGTDPTTMQPLYEAVETTAVDRLFDRRPRARPERLSLSYEGCVVAVYGDGRIVVAPSD
ncbi:HalOD1 output domain-containing protein [Natrinema sp. H-ect1]|uniref:HalOD1 output domain-containing protein n=1 Tax=Natrinema sp. H-ect1 TaxID=3242700 RepID=UPI00359EE2CE